MSNDTFQVNYDVMSKIAIRFGERATIIQGLKQSIEEHMEHLCASGWLGEAADKFQQEANEDVLPRLSRLFLAMQEAQDITNNIIDVTKSAEETASNVVRDNGTEAAVPPGSGVTTKPTEPPVEGTVYTVKPGDTLWGISQHYGVTVDELVAANNIADRNLIHPGQEIIIPGHNTKAPATPAPANPAPNSPANLGDSGRTAQQLNSKINSFNVETNPRYKKLRDGNPNTYDTYCNLYASDVAQSMGAPLPIFVTDSKGNVTKWLGANLMKDWLNGNLNVPGQYQQGPAAGWVKVDAATAAAAANKGHVTIAAGYGHMAVVRAGNPAGVSMENILISQAGEHNFNSGQLKNGWGSSTSQAQVDFYVFKG